MGQVQIAPGEPEQIVSKVQARKWEIRVVSGEVTFGKADSLSSVGARRTRVEGERFQANLSAGEELFAHTGGSDPARIEITRANFSTASLGDTGGDGGDTGDGVDLNADGPVTLTPYVRGDKTTVTVLVTGADGDYRVQVRDENNPDLARTYPGGASTDVFEEVALFTSSLEVVIEDQSGATNTINYGVRVD